MSDEIAGVGRDAVVEATGEPWAHWFGIIDDGGGEALDHAERVAAVADAGVDSGWWQQHLAVAYERDRGLREVGETADGGYQVGVQRTLPVTRERLWNLLTAGDGLAAWLGEVDSLAVEPGATYETADGTAGEIRTVSDGERVRLTWQPADRGSPTTLQVTLSPSNADESRTAVRFHHEKLADGDEREAMREHWRAALDRLATVAASVDGDG